MNQNTNEAGLTNFGTTDTGEMDQGKNKNPDLSGLVISLLKGVLYKDDDAHKWQQLLSLQASVRDYIRVLGLELVLDEAEGYAFFRSYMDEYAEDQSEKDMPTQRLVARRQLSFPVSLLLALIRKKLAEFDASAGDTRLVLSRDEIVELIRVFLPDTSNEARLVDQLDQNINKVVKLGFLRVMKQTGNRGSQNFEVRRIIKAFVDAQWLMEFDQRLAEYISHHDGIVKTGDQDIAGNK